jgi:short subunit dehydrogenase-like uncharacterized protein
LYRSSDTAAQVLAYFRAQLLQNAWFDADALAGTPEPSTSSLHFVHSIQEVDRPAFAVYVVIDDQTNEQTTQFQVILQIAGPFDWGTTPICRDLQP